MFTSLLSEIDAHATRFAHLLSARADDLLEDTTLVAVTMQGFSADSLWKAYLKAIPAQYNPIFRQRPFFDGNYDKSFIRRLGPVLFLDSDGSVRTIFSNLPSAEANGYSFFDQVAADLEKYLLDYWATNPTISVWYHNRDHGPAGSVPTADSHDPSIIWQHYYAQIPAHRSKSSVDLASDRSERDDALAVALRAADSTYRSALETVLEMIDSDVLYRGQSYRHLINTWLNLVDMTENDPDYRLKLAYRILGSNESTRYLGTAIGTLVSDIAEGKDITDAVNAYGAKVDPINYRRSSSVVTPAMIARAQAEVEAQGLVASLPRQLATKDQVPDTVILHRGERTITQSIFEDLTQQASAKVNAKTLADAPVINTAQLLELLPSASSVELAPSPMHRTNRIALVAPANPNAPSLTAWDNPFTWAYLHQDTADVIAQRVKDAGGDIEAPIRISLSWLNTDDLDLHIYGASASGTKGRGHIFYGAKHAMNGELDVDMNVSNPVRNAVENVVWKNERTFPAHGVIVSVDNFTQRELTDTELKIQVKIHDETFTFTHPGIGRYDGTRELIRIKMVHNRPDIQVLDKKCQLESTSTKITDWVVADRIYLTPNAWGEKTVGNRILVFETDVLEDETDASVRGFFTEHLHPSLASHRKTFELLGSKMRATKPKTGELAVGYGFSSASGHSIGLRITDAHGSKRIYRFEP